MIKKIIYWTVIILTVIIILLLILLPGIVKKYTVNHQQGTYGLVQIALDKLKINYFTGTVKITDFKMFESDDKEVFLTVPVK